MSKDFNRMEQSINFWLKILNDNKFSITRFEKKGYYNQLKNIFEELLSLKNPGIQKDYPTFNNSGISCYLNSALQLLFSMDSFIDKIISLNINLFNEDTPQNNAIYALITIFEKMRKNEVLDLYKNTIQNKSKKLMLDCLLDLAYRNYDKTYTKSEINLNRNKQNDPEEFISLLLQKIIENNEVKALNLESVYFNTFQKEFYCNDLTTHFSTTKTPLSYIQCSIINEYEINLTTLQDSIDNYTKISIYSQSNVIDGRCNNEKPAYERIFLNISQENQYIIIQLKRYKFINASTTNKIKNSVTPQQKLKIISEDDNITHRLEYTYELVGCILHSGDNSSSGHYVYFKYIDDNNSVIINDSQVNKYNNQTNSINTQGYFYLYKKSTTPPITIDNFKIDKNNLPLPLPIVKQYHHITLPYTHHHITQPDKYQQSTQPQLTQSDFNSLSPQEQYEYINPQLYLHSQQQQQQSLKSPSIYPQLYQQKQQQSIKSPFIYPQLYHQEQQQQQLQQFPNLQKQPEAPRIIKHKKGKVSKFLNIFKRKTKKHFMDINTNSRFKTNKTNKTKHITPRKKTKKRNIFRKILNKFKRKKKISKIL